MSYAETEGYVPVTAKAQQNPSYQDYLARRGEDNNTHYSVKIDATRLLLDHITDTFTTPVFNGSASLREAAGQLVEDVVKSKRRRETIDDAYLTDLFSNVTSLYRLDQISAGTNTPTQLGPLPSTAVWLLGILGGAWVLIASIFLCRKLHGAKRRS